jgi:N-formylglutamate deformylase
MTQPDPVTTIPECCIIRMPAVHSLPVVFASPHSGRRYPRHFLATTRLDEATLRRSEDSYVDDIFGGAPDHGAPLIAATFPRAYCDVNREAWELDPAMFEDALPPWVNTTSARVGAGLGMMARVVANGEAIYGIRLRFADAQARVKTCWQPYHDALTRLVDLTVARFGLCLLVDCHSMPSSATIRNKPPPDIVLGDVHGAACAASITRALDRFYTQAGYATRRNDPYAGGYVARHYGRPHRRVHAIQIEMARSLYMDEQTLRPGPGLARLQETASGLMRHLPFVLAALQAAE